MDRFGNWGHPTFLVALFHSYCCCLVVSSLENEVDILWTSLQMGCSAQLLSPGKLRDTVSKLSWLTILHHAFLLSLVSLSFPPKSISCPIFVHGLIPTMLSFTMLLFPLYLTSLFWPDWVQRSFDGWMLEEVDWCYPYQKKRCQRW